MSKRCALYFVEYVIFNSLILLLAFCNRENFDIVTWMSIIQMVVIVGTISLYKRDCMLVSVLFVAFTYLFHFGQALIKTLNFNDVYAHRSVLAKTSFELFIRAELFAMTCLFFLGMGVLIANKRLNACCINRQRGLDFDNYKLRKIRKAGYIILFVTIIPMMYIDLGKISALKVGSYLDTYAVYSGGIEKYLGLIGQFARPAITIVLFSYVRDKKRASIVLLLSSLYFGLMMLSGDRSTNLIYIIANCFVYFKFVRKLKKREIILGIIVCYLGLAFLSSLSLFRYSEFSLESFIEVLRRRSKDGILYSVLREFGGSMLSLVYALKYFPSYADYNYGFTYFASLVTISPAIPDNWAEILSNSFAFTKNFPLEVQDSLGGSFLGELYFNFGWLGTIMTFIVGWFIGKVDYCLDTCKEPKYGAMQAVLIPTLILWVRDFFCGILFRPIWVSIILLFF